MFRTTLYFEVACSTLPVYRPCPKVSPHDHSAAHFNCATILNRVISYVSHQIFNGECILEPRNLRGQVALHAERQNLRSRDPLQVSEKTLPAPNTKTNATGQQLTSVGAFHVCTRVHYCTALPLTCLGVARKHLAQLISSKKQVDRQPSNLVPQQFEDRRTSARYILQASAMIVHLLVRSVPP